MKNKYLKEAIKYAKEGMDKNCGGPFGAVIIKEGQIIGAGFNRVLCDNDPTAHGEIVAIRNACAQEKSFWLTGSEIYTVCEPCPMCLAAIYWAHIDKIYYANTHDDASKIGFDDASLYEELGIHSKHHRIPVEHIPMPEAKNLFDQWMTKPDKTPY